MSSGAAPPRTLATLVTLVFLVVLVRTAWLSDDALISLRTVLNVTHGYGLTFNIAERVQTFTHPLWLLLVTLAYLVLPSVYLAAFVVSFGVSLAAFWLLLTRAASPAQGMAAAVALLFSRAFVDFSTSGLENPLCALLVLAFVAVFTSAGLDERRRLTWLAALTSLLYLTRPDAVLFVVPLLLVACYRARRPAAILSALAIGAIPAVAWTLFALVYYGAPFPNTAYAKLATHISRTELWSQGALYLIDSIDRDPLTLTVIGLAIAVAAMRRRAPETGLAIGIALYLLYVIAIGGDFMAGRFLSVALFAAVLLLAWLASGPWPVWTGAAAVFVIVGLTAAHVPLASDSHFDDSANKLTGIIDERGVYFKNRSLVLATRSAFRDPEWPRFAGLPSRITVMQTCGLMGSGGLEWGPTVHLLDECALADPLLARLPAVFNPGWRTGHYRRMIPDGYEDSLATGGNALTDQNLHAFYDDIRLMTRAPLFSRDRWRAIMRVNTGRDDRLVNVPFYRHSGSIVPVEELAVTKEDGTPWNAPGTHVLTGPLAVTCADRPGRRYLDISLDSNDGYTLTFLKRDAIVSTLDLGPVPEYRRKPGLASYTVDIPPRAHDQGFDTIVIAVRGGDDHYAVGHLLLDGVAPTDPELHRRVAVRDSREPK